METGALNCVVAFIRPFQLDAVVDALRHARGFAGLNTSVVRGMGVSEAHPPRSGERAEVDPFCADQKTVDAVIRNFEVMGEAARHVDDQTAQRSPGVPWLDVRDMTILDDLPALKRNLRSLMEELGR